MNDGRILFFQGQAGHEYNISATVRIVATKEQDNDNHEEEACYDCLKFKKRNVKLQKQNTVLNLKPVYFTPSITSSIALK